MGTAKARYSPTAPIDTTAKNATGDGAPLTSTATRAGRVMIAAITAVTITPLAGTFLPLSADHSWWPGTARSRLNANSMRDALVWQATVQKNCPAVEMNSTMATHLELIAWLKITATAPPPFDTASESWTANRNDSSRIQPPMPE